MLPAGYTHDIADMCACCGAGWLLFMVFAGVGLVALPLDCIREFFGRPRSTITKSEYIKRAKGLGQRANSIKVWSLLFASAFVHHLRPKSIVQFMEGCSISVGRCGGRLRVVEGFLCMLLSCVAMAAHDQHVLVLMHGVAF